MGRRLSYQRPDRWEMFEVTMRAHQGRFLMGASEEAGRRIIGVVGRGLKNQRGRVKAHVFCGVSNHLHFLISTEDSISRKDFLCFVATNISKELGKLHDWPQALVGKRSSSIAIVDDPALRERAIYVVAHGRKEGLLGEGESWPGMPVREALLGEMALTGVWYDRTSLCYAHRKWANQPEDTRGPEPTEMDFASEVTVPLAPLPYLDDDHAEQRAEWASIYAEMALRYPVAGRPKGLEALMNQDPQFRPKKTSNKYAPKAHFTCPEAFAQWNADYREYVSAFRQFTKDLAAGVLGPDRWAEFPEGGVPPAELLPAFARR